MKNLRRIEYNDTRKTYALPVAEKTRCVTAEQTKLFAALWLPTQ